ncbi:YfiR/HmsC family protein [Agaribacterium haliotis]|uniref:YfiR/HmsC family protein n=1 Tax=Agaribacterium haliotis TaxID=2013869 RepID=UPI0013042497|nr:YfiR/HmsC family protein [Agaribacterium haliotis]
MTLLCTAASVPSHAQNRSETYKAALVYKILEQIKWPPSSETFDLAYLGADKQQWQQLQLLHKRSLHGRQIKLQRLHKLADAQNLEALVLDAEFSQRLEQVSAAMQRQGTLVISDTAKQKNLLMVNFIYPDKKRISFELNRYQIISAGLQLSNDILLLGGSEVDIAEALNELNHTLRRQLDELGSDRKKLKQLQHELQQNRKALTEQQQQIASTQTRFDKLKSEYLQLIQNLDSSREQLLQNNNILSNQQNELAHKESSISALNRLIDENKNMLTEQANKLQQQRAALGSQEQELQSQLEAIKNQGSKIRLQTYLLAGSAITLFIVLAFGAALYRISRARKNAYDKLELSKKQVEHTLVKLKETQQQLVMSEKMAALGSLVAGVAHEINTPLGVGVTAASHLSDSFEHFKKLYQSGELKRSDFEQFIEQNEDAGELLLKNLSRASDLIRNFKQVAVDQSSEERRHFNLHAYCLEIWDTLYHHTKQQGIELQLDIDNSLELDSYPGMLSQVITNLIMNSMVHAFAEQSSPRVYISADSDDECCRILYRDNGCGIDSAVREQIFDPFFTTRRSEGGSGLGMHICFNLIQQLGGSIDCLANANGAQFELKLPLTSPALGLDVAATQTPKS